jgi:hypothetical protein
MVDSRTRGLPPSWPRAVPPPAGEGWVRDASAWLLDVCPPEYRGYEVLRRHPRVLAAFAAAHVAALRRAATDGLARVRTLLAAEDPGTVSAAVDVLETEQARLELLERSVGAVRFALEAVPRSTR